MKDLKTLKWIFGKVKHQGLNFVLVNILNVVYSVLSIYLILVSKNVIDAAVAGLTVELRKNMVKLIGISLAEIGLKAILASIHAVTRAKLEISFKQNVLQTILNRNYEKITQFHSGELMTRMASDVNLIIDTLLSLVPSVLSMLTKLICATVLLFQISQEFVAILLMGGVVLFVVVNLFKPYLKEIHKKVQEAGASVRLFLKEVLDNLLVIKIFEAEKVIADKSMELQNERYRIQMKRRSLSIASSTGFSTIFQVVYLYALIWSANSLYAGSITVGGLTSIMQLIVQVQSPIIGLSRSFQSLFSMMGSAERVMELEQIEADKLEQRRDKDEIYGNLKEIVVENLDFTYEQKKILNQANFSIKKGEIVAIYGESGIGKSTLLKLILGIIEKDKGRIYFETENQGKIDVSNQTRAMFTYVPQGKFVMSGTIRENITFVNPSVSDEVLQEALEVSNSKTFIEDLPEGLETKIGENGSGLSEGQLQRLSLARALVSEAPILILDEVTSSLDRQTEAEVLKQIKHLKNRTCLIVTHRDSISSICDREFVLEEGKLKEKEK